jgi:hypothetical protein
MSTGQRLGMRTTGPLTLGGKRRGRSVGYRPYPGHPTNYAMVHTGWEPSYKVIGWNLAVMSKAAEEAAEKLSSDRERERAHLDEECMGDNVEREAKWCQETINKVLDAKAKIIRIRARSRRSWNSEIKERGSTLGRQKRRGRR